MSQPIYLYDENGNQVVLHAPAYAAQQVVAGLLFYSPPKIDDEPLPPAPPSDNELSLDELRQMAKDAGVRGYARMKRETLLERINV
jgi:hypothetical protein